jgi:Carboxypeptidase regulatory-like domain/PDZ domain
LERVRVALVAIAFVLGLGTIPGSVGRASLWLTRSAPVPTNVGDRDATLVVTTKNEAGNLQSDVIVVVLTIVDGVAYEAARGATDEHGVVRLEKLPRGDAWVLANAPGRARASSHLLLVQERAIDLVMVPEHTFDVTVHDPEGKPIEGATVEAHGAEPLPVGASTDDQGRAHVGRLGVGPWSITIKKDGYDTASDRAKDGDTLTITLRRLGSILVHVIDADGKPAQDARVQIAGSALWPAREGKTGEKGMVKLAGLYSGSYALRATWKLHASATELSLMLAPGENKEIDLVLLDGRMVTVLVADGEQQDAAGIAGARVVLTEGGLSPFPLEAITDRSGHATLGPIAPGNAIVSARADDYVPTSASVPEPLNGEVRLVLEKAGAISGRVVDARGFPIAGATLEVVGTDARGGPIADDPRKSQFRDAQFDAVLPGPVALIPRGELGVLPGPVPPIPRASERVLGFSPPGAPSVAPPWVTKNDGTFDLSPVTPGRVRVLVRHPEFVEALSDAVNLAPGGRIDDLVIVLRKGGELEGRVVDTDGRPVAGARLEIVATRGSFSRTTRTATDGTFAFSSVPDACTVDVYRDEDALHPSTRVSATVPEDGKRDLVITLPPDREGAEVSVRDGRGFPIEAAQLTLLSLDPSVPLRETAFTDAKGDASLANALALPVRLEVRAPDHAPKVIRTDALAAHVDVTLDAGITATGEVRAARGNEPPSATIVIYTDLGRVTVSASAEGAFELHDLGPGPARIIVRAPGFATLEKSLTLTATSSGRPTDLGRFELEAEGIVEGVVQNDRGDPVPGARVAKDRAPSFLPAGKPVGFAVTDAKGRFSLGELSEGTSWIEAYAPDVGTGRVSVRINGGRTTGDVRIVLLASGKTAQEPAATGSVAVTLGEASGPPRVVVIVAVAPNSEAERGGLQPDDVIETIDGSSVTSMEDARAKLSGPVEHDVIVEVLRQNRTERLRVGREAVHR